MIRDFIEDTAALVSIILFAAMVLVWAHILGGM
jgi:hypothetical protein